MSFYQISGGANVKFTRKVTYQCENCGREFSYLFTLESVKARTVGVGKYAPLSSHDKVREDLAKELAPDAIAELNKEIKSLTENKNYGYEKCPGCGYTQSWMLDVESSAQSSKFIVTPWIILTIVLVVLTVIIIWALNRPDFPFLVCLASFIIWVLATFLIFLFGAKRHYNPNAKFGIVERKNIPEVIWSGPEIT